MHRLSEAETRKEMIDPQLEKAGWYLHDHTRVRIEIPVDGYDAAPWNGVSDYILLRENGEVLAVVEAKKMAVDVRQAEAQLTHYVKEIERHQPFRPFGFLTNGFETYFVDVERTPKRLVAGFFTLDDLENMLFTRQQGAALDTIPINSHIVDRAYQHEAIRRVGEAFTAGKRKALIVMATGTGKTRTAMGLIDVFLRANQARRVLFVADRDALVIQAKTDGFEKFIPNEPCTRLHSWDIGTSQRLYAVTLQTLSNNVGQFSPAYFDLIIFDEVHRSIFNKFNEVLQYFDGRQIGLTATPANYIERDTFLAFDCTDGKPTYLYTYEQAIQDGYLVDFDLYAARTRFQRAGIKGVDLSEEDRNSLLQQGIDPDDLDYDGTEIERTVSNKDTLRKQWAEIMDVCLKDASGQLPGKTILFAMTQEHALRLEAVFNEMYPQFPEMAKVITHKSEYRGALVDAFKKKDQPRLAISVDMLDTGIDVPEAVNLVFMKPVQSPIKLQQMIGRGTRCQAACSHLDWLPNGEKKNFLILDFWENNFSKEAKETVENTLPVLVAIFNTRLRLLETYLGEQSSPDCQQVIADLREQIGQLPIESFTLKRLLPQIEEAWQDSFWYHLTLSKLDFLKIKIAPHLRLVPGVDVAAATFVSKIERLKWLQRTHKDADQTLQSIAEDAALLPSFVLEDPQLQPLARLCSPEALQAASPADLNRLRDGLAPQMRYKTRPDTFRMLDLPDFITLSGYILLTQSGEQVYVAEYRRRVEQRILDLVANHPAVQAIQRAAADGVHPLVDDWQLLELERTLQTELGSGDLELSPENIRKAYGLRVNSFLAFARQVLDLDELPDYADLVQRQFEAYITAHNFNADQIRFLRAVQSVFVRQHRLEAADLYEPPLTSFGVDAVDRWFSPNEIQQIMTLTQSMQIENQSM